MCAHVECFSGSGCNPSNISPTVGSASKKWGFDKAMGKPVTNLREKWKSYMKDIALPTNVTVPQNWSKANPLITVVTLADVNKSIGQAIPTALTGVLGSFIESGLL